MVIYRYLGTDIWMCQSTCHTGDSYYKDLGAIYLFFYYNVPVNLRSMFLGEYM